MQNERVNTSPLAKFHELVTMVDFGMKEQEMTSL